MIEKADEKKFSVILLENIQSNKATANSNSASQEAESAKIAGLEKAMEKYNNMAPYEKAVIDIEIQNKGCKEYFRIANWLCYSTGKEIDKKRVGKWMLYGRDLVYLNCLAKDAVLKGIVSSSKVGWIPQNGAHVVCFYLDITDKEGHKKILKYLIDNECIPKNKDGRYKNIAFKMDMQTDNGEYGKDFKAKLNLEDFIDRTTGEFKEDD